MRDMRRTESEIMKIRKRRSFGGETERKKLSEEKKADKK